MIIKGAYHNIAHANELLCCTKASQNGMICCLKTYVTIWEEVFHNFFPYYNSLLANIQFIITCKLLLVSIIIHETSNQAYLDFNIRTQVNKRFISHCNFEYDQYFLNTVAYHSLVAYCHVLENSGIHNCACEVHSVLE